MVLSVNARPITLIAGPTASGKSTLAMRLARETGAEIIGADSMQIYRGLEIVTAAPNAQDKAAVPHHLVSVADAAEAWSVGRWQTAAKAALADIAERGKPAIVVGGTGLYFRSLTNGLVDIPNVSREVSSRLSEAELRSALKRLDPAAEARIGARDLQRLIRAHAVAIETGKALSAWQAESPAVLPRGGYDAMVVEPDREALYAACDRRLEAMIGAGALEEVRALLDRNLGSELPAMKAVGVRELSAYIRGEASLDDALEAAKRETRRYAKRQLTWLRNQTPDWPRTGRKTKVDL
jgi:tRNA dimethylallyltransferase